MHTRETTGAIVLLAIGIGICVLTMILMSAMAGMTYQLSENTFQSIGEDYTAGGFELCEDFNDQPEFSDPSDWWYTFTNTPWVQSFTIPDIDCSDGNMSQYYEDLTKNGNRAYGTYDFDYHGKGYEGVSFWINTTGVSASVSNVSETFETSTPGNATPEPEFIYIFNSTNVDIHMISNMTIMCGNNTQTFHINNTGYNTTENIVFGDSVDVIRVWQMHLDFNLSADFTGNTTLHVGYPMDEGVYIQWLTDEGTPYLYLWYNDASSAYTLELDLEVWYTMILYFGNNELELKVFETCAENGDIEEFPSVAFDSLMFCCDMNFTVYDSNEYGNSVMDIDNWELYGYDDLFVSNAFKVEFLGTDVVMIIDEVDDTNFDVGIWDGSEYNLLYSGLDVDTWYKYDFTFDWVNNEIFSVVSGPALFGLPVEVANTTVNMTSSGFTGLTFSGFANYDCGNYVDEICIGYITETGSGNLIRTAIEEAVAGGMIGLSQVGGFLPVIALAIVIVLVMGLIFGLVAMDRRGFTPPSGGGGSGAL
jgi:hypothetical protein